MTKSLTAVATAEQAINWLTKLNSWYTVYGELTRQRTYLNRIGTSAAPDWVKPGQRWWYTHDRLRRAYRLLTKLVQRDELFTHLRPELAGLGIAATTNRIEGGINAALRDMLRRHRGMPAEHQLRAIEWWLFTHAIEPTSPASLVRPEHHQQPTARDHDEKPFEESPGPALYDTGLTADEGLWHRRGWAGHS